MRFKMGRREKRLPVGRERRWTRGSGWFFILLAAGGLVYIQAMKGKSQLYDEMMVELRQLETQKMEALELRDELALQIQSQSDPAWVEMVLKRNLGMVREGQMKVYFHAE